MLVWLIIVVIMVVSLTVLALLHKSKVSAIEKFQNISGLMSSTSPSQTMSGFLASISGGATSARSLKSATTTFTSGQQNYLDNVLGKEVMTNDNMPNYANIMNPAVNQPDVYLNTPENIIVRNLQTDNASQFTEADIQFCRSAKMPANLPPHVRGATVGCGWYYVPDPNLSSSGALGQTTGPIFPKGPNGDGVNGIPNYGNGQWIWDLTIAQQLEEIKNCARIKTCITIDAPSVSGLCGFCPPSGVAIPVNIDGTEKYPKTVKIGNVNAPSALCNTPTIMRSAGCPVPPGKEKPLITPQGINCGTLGYPSPDYSIRLYTSTDCTEKMSGSWAPNGECLVGGDLGGSFSAMCSALNGVKPATPEPTVCTPDINGRLSTACLVTLAKSLGYTPQGAIIKLLQTRNELGVLDKVAMQVVKAQNVAVAPELYKGGVITVQNAIKGYDKLYSLIRGGADLMTQQAASWLCIGTNNFDPCNLPDNTPGPFIDQCIEQQWRIAGCQPAGTQYPSDQSVLNRLNALTWGKVKEIFTNTYNAMAAETDPVKQDVAVLRCLGINTKRTTPLPCKGVSREALVINVDSTSFRNTREKDAYTMNGVWKSANAVYRGDLIASGTRVADAKGVQFDGTTVLGTPNLIAQVLGLPLSTRILNGPDPSLVTSPRPPGPPPPTFITNFTRTGDIGMGNYVHEVNAPSPGFLFNTDQLAAHVQFQQISRDLAKGVEYQATVKGNRSGTVYSFPITQASDGTHWVGYFGNPNVKKPSPMMFNGDNELQFTITKYQIPTFDATQPILTAAGTLRDIGYPPGGTGIWSDGKNFNVVFTYAISPIQSPDGTMPALVDAVNAVIKAGKQNIVVTINVLGKGLSFSAPITSMGSNPVAGWVNGTGPAPRAPDGPYYYNSDGGRQFPPFTGWGGIALGGNPQSYHELSLNITTTIIETRELWINPNVETCEILAVFSGPTYSTSHTVMALYKGELMIALDSNEKGYTFFNAGRVPIGQFSHIVHVYNDDGTNEVYINGAGPVVLPEKLTRKNYRGYVGYSLGGGSSTNPLYQRRPFAMPFQGQIGAFRVYNRAFGLTDVQNNLSSTIDTYINLVDLATKNDPNALAMSAGQFYIPSLSPAINFQPSPTE